MWLTKDSKQENEAPEVNSTSEPTRAQEAPVLTPDVDIREEDNTILLVADMPGVTKENVDLTLEKKVLTIEGRSNYKRPKGLGMAYAEFQPGSYRRSFTLNEDFDRENIEASIKDGVLTVVLHKAQPSSQKITVK